MQIKHFNTIKDYFNKIEPFLFFILYILGLILIVFLFIAFSYILEEDITKKENIANVQKTAIVIKKKNGLTNEFFINSNGLVKIKTSQYNTSKLFIKEKGKNHLGIDIENIIMVENVDTFYIKK
jgi:hypothetical protein